MVWVWLGLLFGAAIGSLGGLTGILLGALIGVAAGSLAYGSATVPPNGLSIASIVPGYEATTSARERPTFTIAAAAEPHTLGGEAKLGPPVDWKTWSLWAALVLAVAALGFMAWRLSQQAARGSDSSQTAHRSP